MDRYSYYNGESAGVCMKLWYGVVIVVILSLAIAECLAQDNWLWVRNDDLLNPSGINARGCNSPYLYDIDSDSDKDLISGENGIIELYYNDGFPAVQYWRKDTTYFSSLQLANCATPAIGDFDLDGQVELVAGFIEYGGYPNDSLRVWRNTGTPQTPQWTEIFNFFNFSTYNYCYPRFIDWDSDGDYDLITGRIDYESWGIRYEFLRNIGVSGTPLWQTDSVISASFPFERPGNNGFDIADFNGDGNYDLLWSHAYFDVDGSPVIMFFNLGTNENPNYVQPDTLVVCYGSSPSVSISDIDNDGDYDFIMGDRLPPLYYYKNSGNSVSPVLGQEVLRMGLPFIDGCASITTLDCDNDSDYDVGGSYEYPSWEYYLAAFCCFENIGNQFIPNLQTGGWFPWILSFAPAFYMSSGELTGDSYSDIVFGKGGDIWFLRNRPDSTFAIDYHKFDSINAVGQYYNPEVVDLNSDNRPDIILKDNDIHQLVCYENTDTPGLPQWNINNQLINGLNISSDCVRETHLNRDSLIDLVAIIGQGQLAGFLNIGTPSTPYFQYDSTIFASLAGIQFLYYDLADFDGDDDADIIANDNGSLVLYENRSTLSIEDNAAIPHSIAICRAYPNPFNAQTTISFTLPQAGKVKLSVYDIAGRLVETITEREFPAGENRVIWDASDKRSGVYFVRVNADKSQSVGKLLLLK
jgi:hypothetical protein